MNFAEQIVNIAKERNISVNKICKEAGITAQTFQNWKNGSQPTLDKAIKIIKYLDLSADELFDISPNENNLVDKNGKKIFTDRELKSLERIHGKLDYWLIGHLVSQYGEREIENVLTDASRMYNKLVRMNQQLENERCEDNV